VLPGAAVGDRHRELEPEKRLFRSAAGIDARADARGRC
jgi:hypothetical protein